MQIYLHSYDIDITENALRFQIIIVYNFKSMLLAFECEREQYIWKCIKRVCGIHF